MINELNEVVNAELIFLQNLKLIQSLLNITPVVLGFSWPKIANS